MFVGLTLFSGCSQSEFEAEDTSENDVKIFTERVINGKTSIEYDDDIIPNAIGGLVVGSKEGLETSLGVRILYHNENTQFLVVIKELDDLKLYKKTLTNLYEIEENGVLYMDKFGFTWISENNHVISFVGANKDLDLFNSFFQTFEKNFPVDKEKQREILNIVGTKNLNDILN
jgi:hypothetical protein